MSDRLAATGYDVLPEKSYPVSPSVVPAVASSASGFRKSAAAPVRGCPLSGSHDGGSARCSTPSSSERFPSRLSPYGGYVLIRGL